MHSMHSRSRRGGSAGRASGAAHRRRHAGLVPAWRAAASAQRALQQRPRGVLAGLRRAARPRARGARRRERARGPRRLHVRAAPRRPGRRRGAGAARGAAGRGRKAGFRVAAGALPHPADARLIARDRERGARPALVAAQRGGAAPRRRAQPAAAWAARRLGRHRRAGLLARVPGGVARDPGGATGRGLRARRRAGAGGVGRRRGRAPGRPRVAAARWRRPPARLSAGRRRPGPAACSQPRDAGTCGPARPAPAAQPRGAARVSAGAARASARRARHDLCVGHTATHHAFHRLYEQPGDAQHARDKRSVPFMQTSGRGTTPIPKGRTSGPLTTPTRTRSVNVTGRPH